MPPTPEPEATGPETVIAIAASAGGISALTSLLAGLGADFPVPVLIVQHLDPRHRTVLADILDRRTELAVKLAAQDEPIHPGTVYIAPPDHHLLVERGHTLSLSRSPLVHFLRPAADLLFDSVADAYGPCAVAVVLSGTGNDGAKGVVAVKSGGGTVIAQDPQTAEFRGMPEAALSTGAVDFVLPLEEIPAVIRGLVGVERQ
ncbi:chemotaxis protein CheB [Streptomyces sp. SID8379]|uniref:chemotaxis protein CheB n=1 Tax=unclassified Streptomyces TaxID=2593676 RepID=UPI000366063C|nr:chemotaxis protein CheB [Streptomyces sp. HmicA12]MYW64659.1 chemotaxis protein CheB [Streptomyces sp. SID8379]